MNNEREFLISKNISVAPASKKRILDAEFSIMSQSGWGICWGWDGNRNSCIPKHYNKVCSVMWGDYQNSLGVNEDLDFKGGSDFVVINLGTNDNGAFSQQPWIDESGKEYKLSVDNDNNPSEKDATELIEGIKSFLNNVRQKNPNAKIIWVWGMIKLQILPSKKSDKPKKEKKQFDDDRPERKNRDKFGDRSYKFEEKKGKKKESRKDSKRDRRDSKKESGRRGKGRSR
mgnify:CR=1 FL=1